MYQSIISFSNMSRIIYYEENLRKSYKCNVIQSFHMDELAGINVMPELDVPGHAASWYVYFVA
jgi:hypothetical protein